MGKIFGTQAARIHMEGADAEAISNTVKRGYIRQRKKRPREKRGRIGLIRGYI